MNKEKEKIGFFKRLIGIFKRKKVVEQEEQHNEPETIYEVIRAEQKTVQPIPEIKVKPVEISEPKKDETNIVQVVEIKKIEEEIIEGFEEEKEILEIEKDLRRKRVELEKKIIEKEKEIVEIEKRWKELTLKEENIAKLETELKEKEKEITLKKEIITKLESDLKEKEKEIIELKQRKEEIEKREKELELLSAELEKAVSEKPSEVVLDEDVKKLLPVIDKLLAELPHTVIDGFVKTEDYALYEKILKKYGM